MGQNKRKQHDEKNMPGNQGAKKREIIILVSIDIKTQYQIITILYTKLQYIDFKVILLLFSQSLPSGHFHKPLKKADRMKTIITEN